MKASELRIGNLVNIRFEQRSPGGFNYNYVPSKVDVGYLKIMMDGLTEFSPITLTEEWLLKFGFKNNDGGLVIGIHDEHYLDWDLETGLYIMDEQYESMLSLDKIQYIHQLQNLYFALTGEELILKP